MQMLDGRGGEAPMGDSGGYGRGRPQPQQQPQRQPASAAPVEDDMGDDIPF